MVPARVTHQALSLWLFGLALDRWRSGALAVSATVGTLASLCTRASPGRVARRVDRQPYSTSRRPICAASRVADASKTASMPFTFTAKQAAQHR
jgi:hypothetical protein